MSVRNLDHLFAPRSVAVIGVSDRPGNIGAIVLGNLRRAGFEGPLWAVDRQPGAVDGMAVHPNLDALPQAPDLAVICTPAAAVPDLVDALGRKGTRAAIVLSAGLKREGADGRVLEDAMLQAAGPWLLRVLGPNCLGALVPGQRLNASFAPAAALAGGLAFVSQSGALATAMLDWANTHAIGFSHFVSLGDSADVDFGDLLDYLASDGATRAILLYMESVRHARKFMSAARAAARNKPVIVVKAGRAPDGARAAASHTGALAGADDVFDAAVRRAGMLRVTTLDELFDAATTLARPRAWRGERLAIVTNGGGAGVLAADALALAGGRLATLSAGTLDKLSAVLPANWSQGNPVDIVGDAPVARYTGAVRALLDASEVDGILFMHAPTAVVPAAEIAGALRSILRDANRPVLSAWLGGQGVEPARRCFAEGGLACYATPEQAVAGWMQLVHYHRNQQALLELPDAHPAALRVDRAAAEALLEQARRNGCEWLDEVDSKRLLEAYGIPTAPTRLARDAEEAVAAADDIGYPVAIKAVSPQILHKSDVGGVALDLGSGDEVRKAMVGMRLRLLRSAPGAHVNGFAVQKMVRRPAARELIAGITDDPLFGPVLVFGQGGTAVEVLRDRSLELPPLNAQLARGMVERTRVGKLLGAHRGQPAADKAALDDALLRVSQMACDLGALAELDINPLLADAQGVLALDARIRVRPAGAEARPALRSYPSELEETVAVAGEQLQVRPIRPEDGVRLGAFYADASPSDLRLRFFLARREVPRGELARYSQIDYEREMTFVALAGDRIAGEVRAICDPDAIQAEFAIQVGREWQRQGLGRLLLAKMLAYLRGRGVQEVSGSCLQENAGMVALARRLGFAIRDGGEGTFGMRLALAAGPVDLRHPGPGMRNYR